MSEREVIKMTTKEKAELFFEFMDFISNYDYADCQNFNDFVSKVFSLTMQNLDEQEKNA